MAGLGMLDIKRRISSVSSTQQITKAMEVVSSAKMRRSRERLFVTRPYVATIKEAIYSVLGLTTDVDHPLMSIKEEQYNKSLYIVVASDRGLAGGFNTNIFKLASEAIADKNVEVITVGAKAFDHFQNRKIKIKESFTNISEAPNFKDARVIADLSIKLFLEDHFDEVYLVYTEYLTSMSYLPKVEKILPLEGIEEAKKSNKTISDVIYEPSPEVVLDSLIPKYIESVIFSGLIESAVSEQSSRMVAMKNANENAGKMISELQLSYNRARQAAITQEIAEIVNGAEALKKDRR